MFKKQALLRIHARGICRRGGEKWRIEASEIFTKEVTTIYGKLNIKLV
jgi:hypothetical protein